MSVAYIEHLQNGKKRVKIVILSQLHKKNGSRNLKISIHNTYFTP